MSPTLTATPLTAPGSSPRPLLVLGPSLGTTGERLWGPVVGELARVAHLVVWDLPGHGHSPAADSAFSLAELAEAVAALTEDTVARFGEDAVTGRFHAGVSIGGATSLLLGLNHPGAFDGLGVLCSGPALGTPDGWRERADLVRAQGTQAVREGSRSRWFSPTFAEKDPQTIEAMLTDLEGVDAESYARACEALAGYDVTERLTELRDPVLALAGVDDAVAPPSMAEQIAASAARGRSVTLSGVAHQAPVEDPRATAAALTDLLTSATTGGDRKDRS